MDDKKMPSRQELEAGLRCLQGNLEIIESTLIPAASLLYSKYDALQKAGFTKRESFQIILQRGIE